MVLKYFRDKQRDYEYRFKRMNKRLFAQWIIAMLIVSMCVLMVLYVISGQDIVFSKNIPIYLNPIMLGMFAVCLFIIVIFDDKSKKEIDKYGNA